VIRPASRDDARALAELEVRAWRWAYADIVPEDAMITVAERLERWGGEPLEGTAVHVADSARVVGVVQTGVREDEPGVGALRGLYVEPAAQGAGVGSALHDHALTTLRTAGHAEATLWVFTANGHAREFYAGRGWRPDGGRSTWRGVPELRYRRDLAC